jgi:hypothetical protein
MPTDRDRMLAALRATLMPALRAEGFKGTLPHVQRFAPAKTDVLSVQFSRGGSMFVLELSEGPTAPFVTSSGKTLKPTRFTSYDMPMSTRHRLGPLWAGGVWWFQFTGNDPERFSTAAEQARKLLSQAFSHWHGVRPQPNIVALFPDAASSNPLGLL